MTLIPGISGLGVFKVDLPSTEEKIAARTSRGLKEGEDEEDSPTRISNHMDFSKILTLDSPSSSYDNHTKPF